MMTKTLKLLILQGPPASGKSTYAKKLCKDNPNTWIRVCRDDLRSMCGKYWVHKREDLISAIEDSSICYGLSYGYNVVVDATNLNQKHLTRMLNYVKYSIKIDQITNHEDYDISIEFKEFKIPLWKAIYRDWKRGLFGGRSVGSEVIKVFYKRYNL